MSSWVNKRVLITVRTYPTPACNGIEVSCTGGISDGKWIRLFPVPYRFMEPEKRFKKYQWIDVSVKKSSSDNRPESYKLNIDTINIGNTVSPYNHWSARKKIIFPLKRPSLCAIKKEQETQGSPSLGIFKPAKIKRLIIESCDPNWTSQQKAILSQQLLFPENAPHRPLEKIPYDFRYEFRCTDDTCSGHTMICTDWEMGQSYRKWNQQYGPNWEGKFRQRYEEEMIRKYDTHFYVGTLRGYPGTWIIVGLFYPPLPPTLALFNGH
jgi:hypothetical protein